MAYTIAVARTGVRIRALVRCPRLSLPAQPPAAPLPAQPPAAPASAPLPRLPELDTTVAGVTLQRCGWSSHSGDGRCRLGQRPARKPSGHDDGIDGKDSQQ